MPLAAPEIHRLLERVPEWGELVAAGIDAEVGPAPLWSQTLRAEWERMKTDLWTPGSPGGRWVWALGGGTAGALWIGTNMNLLSSVAVGAVVLTGLGAWRAFIARRDYARKRKERYEALISDAKSLRDLLWKGYSQRINSQRDRVLAQQDGVFGQLRAELRKNIDQVKQSAEYWAKRRDEEKARGQDPEPHERKRRDAWDALGRFRAALASIDRREARAMAFFRHMEEQLARTLRTFDDMIEDARLRRLTHAAQAAQAGDLSLIDPATDAFADGLRALTSSLGQVERRMLTATLDSPDRIDDLARDLLAREEADLEALNALERDVSSALDLGLKGNARATEPSGSRGGGARQRA